MLARGILDKANGNERELASGAATESGIAKKTASPHNHDGASHPVTQRHLIWHPTRPYSIDELFHLAKGDLCKAPVDISTWRPSRQRQAQLGAGRFKLLRTLNATWSGSSSNRRSMEKQ